VSFNTPLLTAAIFLTAHVLPAIASPPPNSSSTYLAQTADDGGDSKTPQEVQAQSQKITVRITSADNGGSGVLIAKKGTTYLVLTNKHVVGKTTKFQIQTPDGQKHAAQLVPNTQIDPKYDTVLLQFTSRQTYNLANLKYDTGTPLTDGREIYSAGFPFDSERLRFTTGAVTQLSDVPLEDGTQIGYITNPGQKGIRQGMSGGPVLDGNGTVIGINTIGAAPILPSYTYFDGSKPLPTKAMEYAKANWGVPIYNVLTQLNPDILYNYENLPKVQRQVTPQGYMAELNRKARKMTVRFEYKDSIYNGSGVIVAKEGNTYYVLTAKHVVWNRDNKQLIADIKTITDDQQSYAVRSSDITLAEGQDLAVVKFTSNSKYPVATLGDYSPASSAIVFVGGFPFRDRIDSPLWQWQLNPGQIWGRGKSAFVTQDKTSFTEGYDLIYSSISYRGMSGGGIFDTEGRVVGIHGKVEGEREFNDLSLGSSLGISIQNFTGIVEKLKVNSKLLKTSKNFARELNNSELATVLAIRDRVPKPQADDSGEQWLQYGNQLDRIQKYAEAVSAFDKAIAKGQKYQLLGNYGKSLALWGIDNSQALTAISTAIDSTPLNDRKKYYYLWRYRSMIFTELEKYDEAMIDINIAISLDPNDQLLHNSKAGIFFKKGQYKEAAKIYDELIRSQPEAYLYNNRGLVKDKLEENKREAILDYDLAISINPNFEPAYNNRGNAKSKSGNNRGAILDYDRIILINPNNDSAYNNRGLAKSKLGDKTGAILDYDRAISINSSNDSAYNNRGFLKSELGDGKGAILDFNQAISINSENYLAYNNRGLAKVSLGDHRGAILEYGTALLLNPEFAEAFFNRGVSKSSLGDKHGAISDFNRAISINYKFAEAYHNRGLAKFHLRDNHGAILDFNKVISIDPNFSQAYAGRGLAKFHLRDNHGAILDFNKAISINSNLAEAYISRGLLKVELGNKQDVISDFNRAADLLRQQGRMDLYNYVIKLLQKLEG
jgi:tetratricopeptide (TPR) repeat protein/S1-C subfamily serine protease